MSEKIEELRPGIMREAQTDCPAECLHCEAVATLRDVMQASPDDRARVMAAGTILEFMGF